MGERFLKVYNPDEVVENLLDKFTTPTTIEEVPIEYAYGLYVAEDIYAKINVPPFRKSLVDGYAVRSSDVKGASSSNPSMLKIIGTVRIGDYPDEIFVKEGMTAYVPTGGVVPDGADAVVMCEETERHGDALFVFKGIAPSSNILDEGSEIKRDSLVLHKGERISERNIGLLNSVGIEIVRVLSPLKIGFFSTGNEITFAHPLPRGKIFDFNRITLRYLIEKDGFIATDYGIVRDEEDKITYTLRKALNENDIVLTTGGTSKGTSDFTVGIINALGKPGVLVHGLNVSPGKPTIFGVIDNKLVVGLSGNPQAVFMIYSTVIRKLLQRKLGVMIGAHAVFGKLLKQVNSRKGRVELVGGKLLTLNNENFIEPLLADSSSVSCIKDTDGYFKIPEDVEGLYEGDVVEFYLW